MAYGRARVEESSGFYRRGARRHGWWLALAAVFVAVAPSCQTVAVTGRRQFNLFSVEQDKQLGAEAYTETMKQAKLVKSGPQYAQVERVLARLIPVVDDPGFAWEFNVIDDDAMVNAWCMPGGKIAVYTGILPVTKDDAGLAVVLGHEIAHAVARHGTERMSKQGLGDVGLMIISSASKTAAEYQQALAVGVDLLAYKPWGRDNELEADQIGLMYMAKAGYDPREAAEFWRRMASASGGQAPPEFLSTHPSDERRIAEIEQMLPKALQFYAQATGTGARP